MFPAFWLVMQDLFYFVIGKSPTYPVPATIQSALPPRSPVQLVVAPVAPLSLSAQIKNKVEPELVSTHLAPVIMYVSDPLGAPRRQTPRLDFDGTIEQLPYGGAVTVTGYQGRYANVFCSGQTGFVEKEAITPEKLAVWPQFSPSMVYLAESLETKKTRWVIDDMFLGGRLLLPLQAGEYIAVRLSEDHRQITWPFTRPRTPGIWQSILRGVPGIHASISPKTASVMEWLNNSGEGALAYVESVSPDLTLTLSAVGVATAGEYTTWTMPALAWRELRPVFIEVL
jgi:hypothetical protein